MKKMFKIESSPILQGVTKVPGDKSISHRSLMLASLASSKSCVKGLLMGKDCLATLGIMRALGVQIEKIQNTEGDFEIFGVGFRGLLSPSKDLDCANSGTTMRLLCGILAGQNKDFTLIGSTQLSGRPMVRIIEPLGLMGSKIESHKNCAPLKIAPVKEFNGIEYDPKIASAQVKSAILLAGLYANKKTTVIEVGPTRDHTEIMLKAMGSKVETKNKRVTIWPLKNELQPININIPGDTSSAAFLLVAASARPGCKIKIERVLLNQTRTGIVDALIKMGAKIVLSNKSYETGELVGDINVYGTQLKGATFSGDKIVRMIDELPVLAVAATQAVGKTVVKDASELKVKETNRIDTIVGELKKMGTDITATPDGFMVKGKSNLRGTDVFSHGDHRIAMALAVAGLFASGETRVASSEVSDDSFPWFASCLRDIGANIRETGCD